MANLIADHSTSHTDHAEHGNAVVAASASETGVAPADAAPAAHGDASASHGEVQAAHGGEHAAPSAFGMDATVWVSIAMLVFLGILVWKKVPAMIGAMLDKRIAEIRQQLDEAGKLRSDAEALKAEYEAKLAAADQEAADMHTRAEGEASAIVDKAKADATTLIARRRKMAEERIAAAEGAALADVRDSAVKAATAAAAALMAEKHDGAADKALVAKTIKSLAD